MANDTIGTIYNDDFQRSSLGSDYTTSFPDNSCSVSIVNNKLRFNRSGDDVTTGGTKYANKVILSAVTSMLSNYTQSCTFELMRYSATTNGLAIQVCAINANVYRSVTVFFNTKSDSSNKGKLRIVVNDNSVPSGTIVKDYGTYTALRTQSNDRYKVDVSMTNLSFSVTITNLNTSATITDSVSFGMSSGSGAGLIQTCFQPAIVNCGGDYDIENFNFGSPDLKNVNAVISGDSTTWGVDLSALIYGVTGILQDNQQGSNKITHHNLPSAISQNIIDSRAELTLLNPTYHIICIGSNDELFSLGNTIDRIETIFLNDIADGREPILCTPIARTGVNLSTLAAAIVALVTDYNTANSTSYKVIDLFAATKATSSNDLRSELTDNASAHLGKYGSAYVVNKIISQCPELIN